MELPIELYDVVVDRGAILHTETTKNSSIGHSKFFIVIGVDEENLVGFFYINSVINMNVIREKSEQWDMQYKISCNDYDFLSHDSYICATEVIRIKKSDVVENIRDGKTKKVGILKDEDLICLLTKCRNSRLFAPIIKKRYFY